MDKKQKDLINELKYMSSQCVANHIVANKKKDNRKALFYTVARVALEGAVRELTLAQHVKI